MNKLKQKLEESKQQLLFTNSALDTIADEKLILHEQQCIAERKAIKYKENNALLKEDCCKLIEENLDISATLLAVQNELNIEDNSTDDSFGSPSTNLDTCEPMINTSAHSNSDFTFQTKQGRRYS